jgi:RNA polymerase sigma factor (sigma-70 family)
MNVYTPTVFVIDDDSAVLDALRRLLRSFDLNALTFASPQQFLDQFEPCMHGCLVLDVEMPDLNGLELQQQLAARGNELPVIFLTGHGDIPMSVRAMKQGAIDFLTKPVQAGDLIESVHHALDKDRSNQQSRAELAEIRQLLATLTPREKEVLEHVVCGKLNKQIAAELGTVEKTVKVHRAHLMAKLKVRTVADLVRLTERTARNAG